MGLARKKSGILLLTLVSFLIFVLFIIVQLFIMKLRKAHVVWKKGEWGRAPGRLEMLQEVAGQRGNSVSASLVLGAA